MITRTYIDKFTTIIQNSELNTGLNPVGELVYGASLSRILVYFNHSKLKKMVEDKTFSDISKLKHYLRITNAGSFDFTKLHCGEISNITDDLKIRATSFDLIFFLIPKLWDNGKGFDFSKTITNQKYYSINNHLIDGKKILSEDGCNWYQARNGYEWDEEGIYSNVTLSKEYDKYSSDKGSNIIIGRQHFDIGNENINLDITDIVNKFIDGSLNNYGIGIAFTPQTELIEGDKENYVGFLTHKTNTFFEPYVETCYEDYISDDRANFILDKNNKLYLYSNIGGEPTNLDEIPTCKVNDVNYEVKQYSKGIYYIDINLSSKQYKSNTMFYDIWGNIKYQGNNLDDIELDFTTKSNNNWFNIGNSLRSDNRLIPTVYGINYNEKIKKGDIRKIGIIARKEYSKYQAELIDSIQTRLYIKDGTREIDVFPWENVNKSFTENFTLIDTSILIPQKYYLDVKIKYNMEEIVHHNQLSFEIVDDLNNKYN